LKTLGAILGAPPLLRLHYCWLCE